MRVSAPPCRACQSRSRASPSAGDDVGDEPAAGRQGRPQPAAANRASPMPPPTKIASGGGKPSSASGAARHHDAQCRDAERSGVARDHRGARRIALDRDGRAALAGAQPFDRDRAATRADIPQGLARQRGERGEGRGADLALGQLAVMLEDVVGKTGAAAAALGRPGRRRQAIAIVLRSGTRRSPQDCASSATMASRAPAEMGEHGEPARPPAEPGQAARQPLAACRRPPTGSGCGAAARGAAASVSSGRPCKVIVAHSASGQPSRAAARLKALGCGRIVISSRGKRRDRVAPMPYHIGSPLANTATRRPRRAAIASIVVGERALPDEPLGAVVGHHREMARAADQHLGGLDQGARRRARPAIPSSPMPMTASQGFTRCSRAH